MNTQIEKSIHHIRKSSVVLAARVVLIVFVIDTFYTLALALAYNATLTTNPLTTSPYTAFIFPSLWILHTIQFFLTAIFLISLIVRWAKTTYYITAHQLIYHHGVVKIDETIYELTHIRTVKLYQSWLGRIFHYGKVTLVLAVSGYRETVELNGIIDPKKYERIFREYIEENKETKKNKE